ncbi:MAG TPA: VOC family protein [Thermoanaerobaculia bacterium]|nr:VOC family protein [Thermoanaerobaculia bacterium]
MAERELIEQLDTAIDALLTGRRPPDVPEIADLVAIAADLRDLPSPAFKADLQWTLVPRKQPTVQLHFLVRGVRGFIQFLHDAFGGTQEFLVDDRQGRVLHARVRIGDSVVEMGDASEQSPPYAFGVHLYVPDVDAVYARALAAGATSLHPVVDQPYGDREGSVQDPYGNHWYIATHLAPEQPVRPGLGTVTLFLHPRGTGRMIEFLESAFGARPAEAIEKAPDGTIAYAAVRLGDSTIEMGEAHGQWQPMQAGIHLYVDDADAIYRQAMAAGAVSIVEPYDAPYGERSAIVIDPFGNHWYIGTPL